MKKTSVLKREQVPEETAWERIFGILYWFPEIEFSLTELAQKAGVSKSTVHRLLYGLKELGIITIIDKGIVFRIKANTESFQFRKMKIAYNLKYLYDSGLVEFLDDKLGHPKAIILIGSYRYGEDISNSDIDIAIETEEEIDPTTTKPEGIERYEKYFPNRSLQIHLFNRKKIDINLFNNFANGIILSGFLEVKP